MGLLCISIGNPLRGDDGVAHRVLELIAPGSSVTKCNVLQLTPELSCEVARAEMVVFIDADAFRAEPRLERVVTGPLPGTPLAHSMTPAEVVYLAERLYGFAGAAWVCHVPAAQFEGEGLSPEAERNARASAELVAQALLPGTPACRVETRLDRCAPMRAQETRLSVPQTPTAPAARHPRSRSGK